MISIKLSASRCILAWGVQMWPVVEDEAQLSVLFEDLYDSPMVGGTPAAISLRLLENVTAISLVLSTTSSRQELSPQSTYSCRQWTREDCLIGRFHQMAVWPGGSAVISVKDEKQRWEDTELWGASWGLNEAGKGIIDQHLLGAVSKRTLASTELMDHPGGSWWVSHWECVAAGYWMLRRNQWQLSGGDFEEYHIPHTHKWCLCLDIVNPQPGLYANCMRSCCFHIDLLEGSHHILSPMFCIFSQRWSK